VEPETDSGATGAYSESHRFAQGEGGDGNSRAIECSVLEPMVYGTKEERDTPIYSRPATGEQSHDPELGSRTDSGRVRGSFCRARDILHRRPILRV
jgi:hypothetical protein